MSDGPASVLSKDLTNVEIKGPIPEDSFLAGLKIWVRFPLAQLRNDAAKDFFPLAENQGLAPPKRHLNLA
jgi:hypothetical protein